MKLLHLYLIGVFVMIAFLIGSTMWQFNQFQGNIKNLQLNLPQELTQGVPDAGQQLDSIMSQIQNQLQNPAQNPVANATTTVETKIWTAPDESFSFEYPIDWIPMNLGEQAVESAGGKILFAAYKTATQSIMPSINSLTVEESSAQTVEELMEKIETDLRAKNIAAKIARSEIVKGEQTVFVVETEQSIVEPTSKITINLKIVNAIFDTPSGKIYTISITSQNSTATIAQEINEMIKSISTLPKNNEN